MTGTVNTAHETHDFRSDPEVLKDYAHSAAAVTGAGLNSCSYVGCRVRPLRRTLAGSIRVST